VGPRADLHFLEKRKILVCTGNRIGIGKLVINVQLMSGFCDILPPFLIIIIITDGAKFEVLTVGAMKMAVL